MAIKMQNVKNIKQFRRESGSKEIKIWNLKKIQIKSGNKESKCENQKNIHNNKWQQRIQNE